jgi:hypothetical protein
MALSRWAFIALAAMAVLTVPPGKLLGQSAKGEVQKSPAEWARDIAHTVSTFAPKQSGIGIGFQSAVAYGNVVEIKYSVADPVMFARLKGQADSFKASKISYFCGEGRRVPLQRGVVIREITATSDGSDKIEIVVDEAACERIVLPALADPNTLAQFAQLVAKSKNEFEKSGGNALLSFGGATSHDGVVEERMIVADAAAFRANSIDIRGRATGYNCGKFREQILRGLVIRYSFVLSDGSPLDDLLIDRSKC